MHQLKFAIGKQQKQQQNNSHALFSMKNCNKSKSQSMWALDPDITCGGDIQNQQDKKFNKAAQGLESSLKIAFTKDKIFSETAFQQIVQNIRVTSDKKVPQLQCLLLIQKKMKQIMDRSRQENKDFNVSFYELLAKRIKKQKNKQKKQDLNQYDRIIHTNFKKKAPVQYINEDLNNRQQYLQIKENIMSKVIRTSGNFNGGDGNSSKNSNSSNQGKLKGLLSLDKVSFSSKDESQRSDKYNQSVLQANQSVSFSSAISQSMAVRQRAPRGGVTGVKKQKPRQKQVNQELQKQDKDQGHKDQAFIFYRPKKGKKVGH